MAESISWQHRALNPARTPFSKHSPRHCARHPRPGPAPCSRAAAAGVAACEEPRPDHAPAAARGRRSARRPRLRSSPTVPQRAQARPRGGRAAGAEQRRGTGRRAALARRSARPLLAPSSAPGGTRAQRPGNIQRPVATRGDALTWSGPKRAVGSWEKSGSAGRKLTRLGRKHRGTREAPAPPSG
ncbi:unnamed protein product [Coccothraustes coccothraustes]